MENNYQNTTKKSEELKNKYYEEYKIKDLDIQYYLDNAFRIFAPKCTDEENRSILKNIMDAIEEAIVLENIKND